MLPHILMIIPLVSHSNLLFLHLPAQLAVHKKNTTRWGRGLFTEDVSHVPQEACGVGEQSGGGVQAVKVVLSILVALVCRHREPAGGGLLVLRNVFPSQVQLAKSVLRVLVALLCRLCQPTECALCIPFRTFAVQQQLAKPVLRIGVSKFSGAQEQLRAALRLFSP